MVRDVPLMLYQRVVANGGESASVPDEPRSCRGIWFHAEPIVHGAPELLLTSEVPLRSLDGDVVQQKVNLLEFTSRQVTQPRACAVQVVRRQLLDAGMRGRCLARSLCSRARIEVPPRPDLQSWMTHTR